MKVRSVNIGKKQERFWHNKHFTTGIFKIPINEPMMLGLEDVQNDVVIDRKYHGGTDKACYIFSTEFYDHWTSLYPELNWNYGMFGENVTVDGLDEKTLFIGAVYKLGTSIVQISEPRQPCSTLSMKFDSHKILKEFIAFGRCGAYLRIVEPGIVERWDNFELIESPSLKHSIYDVFRLLYAKGDDQLRKEMLNSPYLTESTKKGLSK